MLYLGWIFLWLVSGERTKGFNISGCSTKKLLWTYSTRSEEEFILFCDLPEPQKSHFCHRSRLSPTQVPEHLPFMGSKDLSDVQWYRQPSNGDPLEGIRKSYPHIIQDKCTLRFLTPGVNNTGSYICRPKMIKSPYDVACCVKMILEVKPQSNASCENSASHKQDLLLGSTGSISCPSLSCQSDAQSPEVTWYKNGKLLSMTRSNRIVVDEVYVYHQGTYVCDYTQSDTASSWTVRAVVQVRTIVGDTKLKPDILDPVESTLEVELGKPLTISCKARFGFERVFNPVMKWYIKDSDLEWEVSVPEAKSIKSTLKDEIIERNIILEKVTQRDLRRKFVCFVQNSIGNTTQSVQLKEKRGVVLLYILLGTIGTLVAVLVASALLYRHWIEIVLLYRTYQSKDETLGDKKDFDAFVSYAKWSSFPSEVTSSLSEEHLALSLFPDVLENKYGYTLCLLERDVAPGGVYAEDIVSIIKRSRRGIFILSPNYVNGPSIFELQAAVNLALDDQTLKLILIKFCYFQEPESLPHLVKKALRVLPTVTWRGLKSVPPNSRFWTKMRYHMPVKNSQGFTWNQLRITSRIFQWKGFSRTETTGRSSQPKEW
ncbi:interleukin-18 receptor accessory protein [Trachypithecus francoisi]|uniref:interleukin-18 receptor accessory protein n=1 Tax=Trachypithecus francoisi TaxID=54180 RepID=UPI00141B30DA|nr:interleukin-18 receptor accessory protein [Trachypithecus francoisi]XP_033031490.1 interleukin-18 receptor accessory protein [Trachypithecus francoisi]